LYLINFYLHPDDWRIYKSTSNLERDGLKSGPGTQDKSVYVGRVKVEGSYFPGRIQQGSIYANVKGERKVSRSFEYLKINNNLNYDWVKFLSGTSYTNSLMVGGYLLGRDEWENSYIGYVWDRTLNTVSRTSPKTSKNFEILTCSQKDEGVTQKPEDSVEIVEGDLVKNLTDCNENLSKEINEGKKLQDSLENEKFKNSVIELEKKMCDETVQNLTTESSVLKINVDKLDKQNKDLSKNVENLRKNKAWLENDNKHKAQEIKINNQKISNLTSEVGKLKSEKVYLERESSNLKDKNSKLEKDVEKFKQEASNATKIIADKDSEISRLNSTNIKLTKSNSELKNKVEKLENGQKNYPENPQPKPTTKSPITTTTIRPDRTEGYQACKTYLKFEDDENRSLDCVSAIIRKITKEGLKSSEKCIIPNLKQSTPKFKKQGLYQLCAASLDEEVHPDDQKTVDEILKMAELIINAESFTSVPLLYENLIHETRSLPVFNVQPLMISEVTTKSSATVKPQIEGNFIPSLSYDGFEDETTLMTV
jgi:myosin heavy subunit